MRPSRFEVHGEVAPGFEPVRLPVTRAYLKAQGLGEAQHGLGHGHFEVHAGLQGPGEDLDVALLKPGTKPALRSEKEHKHES